MRLAMTIGSAMFAVLLVAATAAAEVRCSARCEGAKTVVCSGDTCSASDNFGCSAIDADGNETGQECQDPKTALPIGAGAAAPPIEGVDTWSGAEAPSPWIDQRTPISDLPASVIPRVDEEIRALEASRLDLTGQPLTVDRDKVNLHSRLYLSVCTATCREGEDPVLCPSLPGDDCWAVSGAGCVVTRPDGTSTVQHCGFAADH